ncbi:MAG: hypothetical protein OXE41_02660 [Gammaproteobacteria bacterium]|nr:hypothetical protein [Gammaproteobacteria bacterium]MCY4219042.1 hypothetical protein [Gammaproteobacteria bacterium]MCY4274285.1 hypothetical protein [Gammaproteobacteria bacterium]
MNISTCTNHEVQLILNWIQQIQSSDQLDGLDLLLPRLTHLEKIMKTNGLDGARMLCQRLLELSESLIRKSGKIDSDTGFGAILEGISKLATYISLISSGFPISPLFLVHPITGIERLFDNDRKTSFDLFQPYDLSLGYEYAPPSIGALEKCLDFDQIFHIHFRKNLSIHLRKRSYNALLELANLFNRIELDQVDKDSYFACLVLSCLELIRYKSDKFHASKTIEILLAEIDLLMYQICLNNSKQELMVNLRMLLRKMLYFLGDTVYGSNRINHTKPQDIGPKTRQICEHFKLDVWFAIEPGRVIQAECEKSIALAVDLAQLEKRNNYASLQNSLALFFLGGLASEKIEEMFAMFDQLKRTVSVHADGILKAYVMDLCETISNVNVHAGSFADSKQDIKIASAWMMLWDFIECHNTHTVERIQCFGQRLMDNQCEWLSIDTHSTQSSDSQQTNIQVASFEKNDAYDLGVNFMRPWPSLECTQAHDIVKTHICNELLKAQGILADIDKMVVGESRLTELSLVMKQVECLYIVLGNTSAIEIIQRAGMLITQTISSTSHLHLEAKQLILIIDSIREAANRMAVNEDVDQDSGMRFDRASHLIEEYIDNHKITLPTEFTSDCGPILEQLDLIGLELKRWREDISNHEIAITIRERFSRLEKLCEICKNKEISRICKVISSMITKDNLTSTSDSTVILNLLLEVHQSIEAEFGGSSEQTQEHLKSILRMVEKL